MAAACLGGALLARALTAGMQEAAFARGGQTERASAAEVLFFRDVFGLPVLLARGVVLSAGDEVISIAPHARRWWADPMLGGLWPWPSVFGLLLANLAFGYCCKQICCKLISHPDGGAL